MAIDLCCCCKKDASKLSQKVASIATCQDNHLVVVIGGVLMMSLVCREDLSNSKIYPNFRGLPERLVSGPELCRDADDRGVFGRHHRFVPAVAGGFGGMCAGAGAGADRAGSAGASDGAGNRDGYYC